MMLMSLKSTTVSLAMRSVWIAGRKWFMKIIRHAIWQRYKRLEGVFTSFEFQNYWPGFVIKDCYTSDSV